MPRIGIRSPLSSPVDDLSEMVVRMSMVIPAMDRSSSLMNEGFEPSRSLPCSGRCGHCDLHPCRLHAPI